MGVGPGLGGCRRDSAIRKQAGDDEVWTHVPSDIKNSRSFFLGRDLGRPPSSANHRVSAIYTLGQKKKKEQSSIISPLMACVTKLQQRCVHRVFFSLYLESNSPQK